MIEGPRAALVAGQSGDLAGFRAGFTGAGALPGDAEAIAFLGELESRYGRFLGSRQDRLRESLGPAEPGGRRIPYVLEFESGEVAAEAEFVIRQAGSGGFVGRFAWLSIRDDELGDLVYPKSAQANADTTAPDPAPPPEPPDGR